MNETIWQRWKKNAEETPEKEIITHWVAGKSPSRWTFSHLISSAERFATELKSNGIKKGDICAIIIRHHFYFYPLYLAVTRLGAIPSVLSYPNSRVHPDKFREGIQGMSKHSGLDWILTERDLERIISPLIIGSETTIRGVIFPCEWKECLNPGSQSNIGLPETDFSANENDPCLLQHSSGTTGLQKPVMLSHKAILTHVDNYAKSIDLSKTDKIISWLPLYHDMGLIAAFHLPLAFSIPLVQIDPFEWVLAPSILLDAVYKEKGTLTWMPNFAFNLMADKIHEEELEGISLKSWRMVINCSEPIRDDSQQKFIRKFSPYGFNRNAVSSSYAMAETVFAVSQSEPGEEPKKITVDKQELAKGRIKIVLDKPQEKICVSSGKAIKGCEVRIVSDDGNDCPDGNVGEVIIKSVSMFNGYRNYPLKTVEVLKEGWYYSGDYGFVHEGHIFIIGRKKDIIIVGGNNIYPEDVENVISQLGGVIPGRVVAFGEEDSDLGTDQISVIAETDLREGESRQNLRAQIAKAAMGIDITVKKIYLVPARWLIKSSSGKPSRKANKERILKNQEEFEKK